MMCKLVWPCFTGAAAALQLQLACIYQHGWLRTALLCLSMLQIWSVQTGMLLVSARGHTGELSDLSLSCDGKLLASGATDGEVRIWSMQVRRWLHYQIIAALLQNSTMHSTVQYRTGQYTTVQCSAVQYSTVQYG
jgi:WD40 repeat protein